MADKELEMLSSDVASIKLLPVKEECHKSLECPICQDYMTGFIMQCVTGHSICASCKEKVKDCPICKKQFSLVRNFALESVIENITFPCKYSQLGCKMVVFLDNREKHGENCLYRIYRCLPGKQNGCKWEGKKDDIVAHVLKEHGTKDWMTEKNSAELENFSLKKDTIEYQIIRAHGEIFWFQSCAVSKKQAYYISVHYIGPKQNCHKFYYSLHFNSLTKSRHKIYFTTETHPAGLDIQDLMKEKISCFCLKGDLVKHFMDENGTLNFTLHIIKDD